MALITGTPAGTITEQDNITLEGAAYFYFQNYDADELNNPDTDDFYWGLTGSSGNPIYNLGCYEDVSLGEDVTVNAVRCDTVGDKDVVQKRNHLTFTLTLQTLFPLSILTHVMSASSVTAGSGIEKMGIGKINNNKYWHVYLPKVYDEDTGDYVAITIHKAKFVDAWNIDMNSGENWKMSGIVVWGLLDDSKPSGQEFATVIRADPSAIA